MPSSKLTVTVSPTGAPRVSSPPAAPSILARAKNNKTRRVSAKQERRRKLVDCAVDCAAGRGEPDFINLTQFEARMNKKTRRSWNIEKLEAVREKFIEFLQDPENENGFSFHGFSDKTDDVCFARQKRGNDVFV
jgi:hypothetical protein